MKRNRRIHSAIIAVLAFMDGAAGFSLTYLEPGPPKTAAIIAWAIATAVLLVGSFVLSASGKPRK